MAYICIRLFLEDNEPNIRNNELLWETECPVERKQLQRIYCMRTALRKVKCAIDTTDGGGDILDMDSIGRSIT